MKKILALVLAMLLVVGMMSAFADKTTAHTIKVTTNGEGTHEYSAFQIFVGNLDATGTKLSDVEWGADMTDAKVAALKTAVAADSTLSGFTSCNTAEDFAKALNGVANEAAIAKAFADAVDTALGSATTTHKGTTDSNGEASINVTGDGYYFIKDTGNIANTDTATRFMLQVVGNIAVTAKDTVLTPDKEIVGEDSDTIDPGVKDNDSSIGDVITYNVTIPVPDTTQYKDHFILNMTDTLDAGLTYFGNMAITIDSDPVTTLTSGTNYVTTVKTGNDDFTTPTTVAAAVETTGGQTIKVVFKDFKSFVETNNLLGKTITISYQVVLNKNAEFGVLPNENDVYFIYSNNPNHDYDGDEPGNDDVTGTTPHSKTKTFVTTLELDKVDGATKTALAGAEFKLTGTSWNYVLLTGEKFEKAPYPASGSTAPDGETVKNGTYYLLKDGTYTDQAKTTLTQDQYVDTTDTYVKVTFEKVVREAKNVDLTLITDENGHIKVEGIEAGTYTLQETKAPSGYNLDNTVYTLVIDWTNPDANGVADAIKNAGGFSKGTGSHANFEMDADGGRFHITIENNGGQTLPSTGGMGTTLFYIGGSLLALIAVVLLVTKRRMNGND